MTVEVSDLNYVDSADFGRTSIGNPLDVPNVGQTAGASASAARIAKLERELEEARNSISSQGAIYNNSSIDIYDANNKLVFHAGPDGTSIKENLTLGSGLIGYNAFANQLQIRSYSASAKWNVANGATSMVGTSKPTDYSPIQIDVPSFASSAVIYYSVSGYMPGTIDITMTPHIGSVTGQDLIWSIGDRGTLYEIDDMRIGIGGCATVDIPDNNGKVDLGMLVSRSSDYSYKNSSGSDATFSLDMNFTVFFVARSVVNPSDIP